MKRENAFKALYRFRNYLIGHLWTKTPGTEVQRAAILSIGATWFERRDWDHRTVGEFIAHARRIERGLEPNIGQAASDLRLGQHVRDMMEKFPKQYANNVMCAAACAQTMASIAFELGGEFEAKIPELFFQNKPVGAWIVTAKRIS